MEDDIYHYSGRTRHGNGRGGVTTDPADLIESRFNAGWKSLVVTHNGRIVGEICQQPGGGPRGHRVRYFNDPRSSGGKAQG